MAARVYLHIGLPKTATTYLQTILWGNRAVIESQGVRLPGAQRREHLWASRVVREDPVFAGLGERQRRAWDRVRRDVEEWPDTAVISHEFFAAASAEQAKRMVEDLAPAEVHLVVTAREPLGLFTASWQESLKNRGIQRIADYSLEESDDPTAVWNWRTLDVRRVLERWSPSFEAERVHVLCLPDREAPRRTIWDTFAGLVGIDPDSVDLSESFANTSMGVVEAETLRRVNDHLEDFNSAIDRGTYIRSFLADQRLVPRGGERFWPAPDRVEECRTRARAAVDYLAEQGFDVRGDLASLLVPEEVEPRRTPESVSDSEVARVAVALVARMLHDVRDLRHERRALHAELAAVEKRADNPPLRLAIATRWPRLRGLVLRDDDGSAVAPGEEP